MEEADEEKRVIANPIMASVLGELKQSDLMNAGSDTDDDPTPKDGDDGRDKNIATEQERVSVMVKQMKCFKKNVLKPGHRKTRSHTEGSYIGSLPDDIFVVHNTHMEHADADTINKSTRAKEDTAETEGEAHTIPTPAASPVIRARNPMMLQLRPISMSAPGRLKSTSSNTEVESQDETQAPTQPPVAASSTDTPSRPVSAIRGMFDPKPVPTPTPPARVRSVSKSVLSRWPPAAATNPPLPPPTLKSSNLKSSRFSTRTSTDIPAPPSEPVAEASTPSPPTEEVVGINEASELPLAEVVPEPPVAGIAPEPEVVSEPMAEVVSEPMAEVVSEPMAEVVSEPVAEVVSEPMAEVVSEPMAEVVSEPVAEVVSEPVAEVVSEPVAEVLAEPPVEPAEEPPTAAEPVSDPSIDEEAIQEKIQALEEVKNTHPDNIAAKVFHQDFYAGLNLEARARFLKRVGGVIAVPESVLGCCVCDAFDYDGDFSPYFSKALAEYHHVSEDAQHVSNWTLPEECRGAGYDIAPLGLEPLSLRIRVSRNLCSFPMLASMTLADRCGFEDTICKAFDQLIGMEGYGGEYVSLTPQHPRYISGDMYQTMVRDGHVFKDVTSDPLMIEAGVSADWPYGRGCYVSGDKSLVVWVGEEDHLRVVATEMSTDIRPMFKRVQALLDLLEGMPGLAFATSPTAGYITSSPTRAGTGMRVSVRISLSDLVQDEGGIEKVREVCEPLGLTVRGVGEGGGAEDADAVTVMDMYPTACFCVTEGELAQRLFRGVLELAKASEEAEELELDSLVSRATLEPNNPATSAFDRSYYKSLDRGQRGGFLKCLRWADKYPKGARAGCYAYDVADYERFNPFFSKVIAQYHGVSEDAKHVSDWTLPKGEKYNVESLGLGPLHFRMRVHRNMVGFSFPGSMGIEERLYLEGSLCQAFEVLKDMPGFKGGYYSITPKHPNFIEEAQYQELVRDNIVFFQDMIDEGYLATDGVSGDWPFGRGCYVSEDKGLLMWVGEEDHLRIMCMGVTTDLQSVYNRVKAAMDVVTSIPGLEFAVSEDYGNLTSCPSNLGTGMCVKAHLLLPNLTKIGELPRACSLLGLNVCGVDDTGAEVKPGKGTGWEGEAEGSGVRAARTLSVHADGAVALSPVASFCVKECDVISSLYKGLGELVEQEVQAARWSGKFGLTLSLDLASLASIKKSHPDNIAVRVFDAEYYARLDPGAQDALLKCLQSGIQNPDSGMGCYANQPGDYDRFRPFFSKALAEYHGVSEDAKHVSDWTLPEGVTYDVETLGLGPLSMRTRVGRNLADFPLPAAMTQADRCAMENKMCEAFAVLIGMGEYGGEYYSITPDHPNFINEEKYQELVKAHIMFKDMAGDSYLSSAGIAGDWPHGRGCYASEDKSFIIWVGEEDHLRIMCMAKSTKIESVFNRLKVALDVVSGIPGLEFAFSEDYGNVTSCPTNLGTGMRSSVHIQLPSLTSGGSDAKVKEICKPLGLSVRGLGGEHTPIGADGTVDISPSARFCIKECEIVQRLFEGLTRLVEAEKAHQIAAAAEEEVRQSRVSSLFTRPSSNSQDLSPPADGSPNGDSESIASSARPSSVAVERKLLVLQATKGTHPGNITARVFDEGYYDSLDPPEKSALLKCLQSGIQNPDSGMGCYANQPGDYDRFRPFFSKALAEYHGVSEDAKHVSDWTLPEGVTYNVESLGLGPLSMRTRVGRNLADFPLPAAMTQADRCAMENKMCEAFAVLIGMGEYGGEYYSITPDHPNFINGEKYQELVKAHIMFKDMAGDSYLTAAGIAGDWPHGRGCYVSEDKGFIIWVGEEDHLRIMCMATATKIESVFNRLKVALDVVSGIPGLEFAFSEDYGNVTSCPTNLGTGMRSSVHIQLPNLTQDGTDVKVKEICKPLGLSVRGLGGEHTPIGADGTVDISPSARFCIKECEIVKSLFEGVKQLVVAEAEAGAGAGAGAGGGGGDTSQQPDEVDEEQREISPEDAMELEAALALLSAG